MACSIGVLRGVLVEAAPCVQRGVDATSETDVCRNHGRPGPIVLPSAHSHHGNSRPGKGSLTFGLNTNACRAVGMLCT